MEIILVIIFILILLVALYFVDAQKNYEEFPYFVYPDGNDKVIFVFQYYIWELNKKEQLKKIFNQSSIVEVEGLNYTWWFYIQFIE